MVLFLPTFLPYNHFVEKEFLVFDGYLVFYFFIMSVFNIELQALLDKAKAPEKFIKFLKDVEAETPMDLAGLASDEEALKKLFAEMGVDATVEQVKVRRAWIHARDYWNAHAVQSVAAPGPRAADAEDAPLDDAIVTSLRDQWFKKYSFNMTGGQMLSPAGLSRIWRGFNKTPGPSRSRCWRV